ncbi:protein MEI2-like 5 [Impatiens glandulifera]|uniref:protein MEI2-like 5 n=1 Tax=Impatiens glandulifera TaxID=253017 RepID=UPI001FB09CFC|nr:protein MEI2-like 5 [Impatiens glandulifera]
MDQKQQQDLVSGLYKIPTAESSKSMTFDASMFSTSLPVFPYDKLNYPDLHDDSGGNGIGRSCLVLPRDENELLDFDLNNLPSQLEELEDDFFYSGGGMELESSQDDISNKIVGGLSKLNFSDGGNGILIPPPMGGGHYYPVVPNTTAVVAGEHPNGEHPSRTLFVRNINSNIEDSELHSLFQQYGDIRTMYTASKHRGFVMISYYDIRDARNAMRALQNKPLRRRKLDIHFSIPKDNPSEKDVNQGTLVAFNLDASVSNDILFQIFGAYGEVKEIRETPHKRHQKFIEFYDVRAAETALQALDRIEIAGKRMKLEASRPGGARRSLMQQLSQDPEYDDVRFRQQVGSPIAVSPPGYWPHLGSPVDHSPLQSLSQSPKFGPISPMKSNHLSGLATILPTHVSNTSRVSNQVIGHSTSTFTSSRQTLGESNSASSGIGMLSGPQFLWGTSPSSPVSECSNSSVGQQFTSQGQVYSETNHRRIFSSSLHQQHYVGSAPSVFPPDLNLGGYYPDSPETSFMNRVPFGGMDRGHMMMNGGVRSAINLGFGHTENINESGSSNSKIMPLSSTRPLFFGNGPFQGMGGVTSSDDGLLDFSRSRRIDYNVNQMEMKKQYQLDLDKIKNCEDIRTTLMLKNIPNKYTSKMLLAAIDENHSNCYDFLYLPIDFKNKCNVGYAFINMISPSHIIPFYEAFNGKKWEKFNSEKVASLAYARIQGKTALVSHFQNSSLMNEDKHCRPILFQSEAQGTDQEPLNSNLNILIRQSDGSYTGDSLESPKSNLT